MIVNFFYLTDNCGLGWIACLQKSRVTKLLHKYVSFS